MICPNCDSMLNALGCQACGWKTGDPFPAHRLVGGSDHPLKALANYPAQEVPAKHVSHVKSDPGIAPGEEVIEVPEPEPDGPDSAEYKIEVRYPDGHWESFSGPYRTREAAQSELVNVPRKLYKKARVVPA